MIPSYNPSRDDSSSNSTTPPSETTLADEHSLVGSHAHENTSPDNRSQNMAPTNPDEHGSQTSHRLLPGDSTADLSSAEDISNNLAKYESSECALLAYARTNNIDGLKNLLGSKLDGNITLDLNYRGQQKQNYSWSALHLACYFGHDDIVNQLLSSKKLRDELDINIRNISGDTPLHKATLTNRIQIVQLLLSNGSSVFVKNCDGLFAKQLTSNKHIYDMLEASEQADKNSLKQNMFKAVDNGDLKKLQEYIQEYHELQEGPDLGTAAEEFKPDGRVDLGSTDQSVDRYPVSNLDREKYSYPLADLIDQMTDDRGNTLLHLAAMRGFKAICVYLLEQGFDPYKKNKLGQTCIELTSYQLRQLFMSVRPAAGRLKKLSKDRVTRFEGPLLRKVRILGWKQIYVVLENGVILLFNNRRDSMNQSRKGYKYLESAVCEPDPNDVGIFNVRFSDNSRATFLVNSNHLNHYTTFNLPLNESTGQLTNTNCQIELIRQKWVNSIRDHIAYSTEFVRRGLKIDDEDDFESMNYDGGSLSTLNHLLPLDTIKSFVQEARAHYSILERHAESLCGLAQSISIANQRSITNSFEASQQLLSSNRPVQLNLAAPIEASNQVRAGSAPNASAGSRLLGLIRSNRPSRAGLIEEDQADLTNTGNNIQSSNSMLRSRNNMATNEFIQDNWPCLLFHLRLLMESTENTKTSMSQALALMEHQEQLRQNRIQQQEERCRVLEDSLQTLARDHHELEKSLSMSQLYQSACRSVSMSTDLNEYHDAFEDFDDEKTMTPNNSLPCDEDLEQRIREVMDEKVNEQEKSDANYNDEDDDLESNCSALTVETVTDQYLSTMDATIASQLATTCEPGHDLNHNLFRTRLPAPMIPRDQVSIWSILKNCIGKELSKITMPVVFNEPLTMLQRSCEGLQYSDYLVKADLSNDPVERMELVCAFIVAALSANSLRIVKPFNPLLYETYELDHELGDGTQVRGFAQQVSHHPPITACYGESDNFVYEGVINPKIKFWGRSVEISHDGSCRIQLRRHKESYLFKAVACSIHNIIVGKLWFEHNGPLDVKCPETNLQANLTFRQAGWFSSDLHRFDGFISSGLNIKNPNKLRFVYGKWTDYIKSVDFKDYENYMKENQQKLFRIPDSPDQATNSDGLIGGISNISLSDSPNTLNNNTITSNEKPSPSNQKSSKSSDKKSGYTKSESVQSLDIPNSKTLWRLETQFFSEYYNFSLFTMKLNELNSQLEQSLPRTDSRFRPDVRRLEEGDLDGAASEKQRLEDKQREARSRDQRFKDPSPDMLWFELKSEPNMKDKLYVYKGGYWENKKRPEKFPDLF